MKGGVNMNEYAEYILREIEFGIENRDDFDFEVRLQLYDKVSGMLLFASVMNLIDKDTFTVLNHESIKIL